MKKTLLIVATCLLLVVGRSAFAESGSIDQISPDGDFIVMDDGNEYDVTGGDASGWSEGDSVWTDGSTMVDTDQDDSVDVEEH